MWKTRRVLLTALGIVSAAVGLGITLLFWNVQDAEVTAAPIIKEAAHEPLPEDLLVLMPSVILKGGSDGLLAREVGRQAFLIAARDELGIRTRDASLREVSSETDGKAIAAIDPVIMSPGDGTMRLKFRRVGDAIDEWDATIRYGSGPHLTALVTAAESLSRKELVEELSNLGFKAASIDVGEGIADPSEQLCDRFDLVSQFSAVRGWHETMQSNGESPERLSWIARCYANLGLLTERHWSPAHKAFRARSLLYAERLLAKYGQTAEGLRTRAYVRTLAGLPANGLEDLVEASKLSSGDRDSTVWVDVLESYCRGEWKRLESLSQDLSGSGRTLARLLLLVEAQQSGGSRERRDACTAVLEVEPACTFAFDLLFDETASLGSMRLASDAAFELSQTWLYQPLREGQISLPADFELISDDELSHPRQEATFREEMTKTLLEDTHFRHDAREPSLTAFGRLIEEEGFLQSVGILQTYAGALAVDADDAIIFTKSWAAHHPFREFLEAHAWAPEERVEPLMRLAPRMHREQLIPAIWPLHDYYVQIAASQTDEAAKAFMTNCDDIFADLVWISRMMPGTEDRRRLAWSLERVVPHSAVTAAQLLLYDRDRVAGRVAAWDEQFSGNTKVVDALADFYVEEMRFDDAIRCLKEAAGSHPEFATYRRLAGIQWGAMQEKEYVATLKTSLEQPSDGLEQAQVCQELAYFYARKEDWDRAQPYAIRSARPGSGWGMRVAAYVSEGLGDFARAEEFERSISERYRDASMGWYRWCLRTGQGDVEAARDLARPWRELLSNVETGPVENSINWERSLVEIEVAEGKYDDALVRYLRLFENTKDARDALQVMLIADQLGRTELRDEYLDIAIQQGDQFNTLVSALGRAFRNELAGEPLGVEDAKRLIRSTTTEEHSATDGLYAVGRFFESRGRIADASPFYELAASSPVTGSSSCLYASQSLRRLGGTATRKGMLFSEAFYRLESVSGDIANTMRRQRNEAALRLIDRALSLEASNVPMLTSRTDSLLRLNRPGEATETLSEILEILPDHPAYLLRRARAEECNGDFERARIDYDRVVAADATASHVAQAQEGLVWLSAACPDASLRNPELALRHAETLMEGNELPAWKEQQLYAIALAANGRFDEAISAAEESLIEGDPNAREWTLKRIEDFRSRRAYIRPRSWWKFPEVPVEAEH